MSTDFWLGFAVSALIGVCIGLISYRPKTKPPEKSPKKDEDWFI